jgi:hypothetical protein
MKSLQSSGLPYSSPSSGWIQQPYPIPGLLDIKAAKIELFLQQPMLQFIKDKSISELVFLNSSC